MTTHQFSHVVGPATYCFRDLKHLPAKASPLRSGNQLAGLAAGSAEERMAAQMALAALPLRAILDNPVIAYESDEVTCPDRATYLQRRDFGRSLNQSSCSLLIHAAPQACDLALIIADGLSALAIKRNAQPFLDVLVSRLERDGWSLAPLVIVRQARMAIGDQAGALLNTRAVAVLIGERPGLSSPDSMGIYMTWGPRAGLSDADRNCISNVRPAGQGYAQAADTLHYLLDHARRRGVSGVQLKNDTAGAQRMPRDRPHNFLLPEP